MELWKILHSEHENKLNSIPPLSVFEISEKPSIPEFSAEKEEIDGEDSVSITTKSKKEGDELHIGVFKKKIIDLHSFCHDFTFNNWSKNTDTKFQESSISLRDEYNHLTPDMIVENGNEISIIEFTTNIMANKPKIVRSFRSKISAYHNAVQNRISAFPEKSIMLFVIAVSPDLVCHNFSHLPETEMENLSFRLRCSIELTSILRNMGIEVSKINFELSAKAKSARLVFDTIQFDFNDSNKYFNKEWYDKQSEEPNMDYVKDQINKCRERSMNDVYKSSFISKDGSKPFSFKTSLIKNRRQCIKGIKKIREELSNTETYTSYKRKPIVLFPLIAMEQSSIKTTRLSDSSLLSFMPRKYAEMTAVEKLWFECISQLREGEMKRSDEGDQMTSEKFRLLFEGDLEIEDDEVDSDIKVLSKRDYHRVKCKNLSYNDRLDLAMDGVQAKPFSGNKTVREKQIQGKQLLNYNTYTGDIEYFLDASYRTSKVVNNHSIFDVKKLLQKAYSVHDTKMGDSLIKLSQDLLNTFMGNLSQIISDIAQELIVSVRQNCRKDEFIMKKLMNFDIYILIKPTKSSEHMFVSLLYNRKKIIELDSSSTVFRPYYGGDDYVVTDFVSFKLHKLKNLVSFESLFLSTFSYYLEFYEINPFHTPPINLTSESSNDLVQLWSMVNFTMLMLLHDKSAAEEIMTQSRYIMMEGFVSFPKVPKPHKMLPKFNRKIRSRLELFILKRLLSTMHRVSGEPFYLSNIDIFRDEESFDSINLKGHKNLFDPIFWSPLKSPSQLINNFYIGYFKNKAETPEKNSSFQLFKKILEWENDLPETNKFLGMEDPDINEINKHEFSRSFSKLMVTYGHKKLKKMLGSTYLEKIETDILNNIAKIDLESMATLKATSNFTPEMFASKQVRKYHRSKVIERVSEKCSVGTHLYHHMSPSLKKLEKESGGLLIDIFKKAQHGGTREIYVMDWDSRVVQLVIETISKTICKYFDSETLTNPRNKFKLQKNHDNNCKKKFKTNEYITVGSSDDAAKWNQGHFVTKFASMLMGLTPNYMHPFICRGLSLWTTKKIMISEEILRLLERDRPPVFDDPIMNEMLMAHKGLTDCKWKSAGTSYIETTTGMMQGILHYTSSLWHTLYLEWLKDFFTLDFNVFNSKFPDSKCIVTNMQSSDDSSILFSFNCIQNSTTIKNLLYISVMLKFKHILGELFGIYESVKCTQHTINVMEFNSEYYFNSNLFRPTIRWVAASQIITENESLGARQEEMYNNITSILEGGGSIFVGAMCQLSQALLHYRTYGSRLSSCFSEFSLRLPLLIDPSLGFFLLDNPCIAGVAGYKYNLYQAIKNTNLGLKYKLMLNNATSLDNKLSEEKLGKAIVREMTTSGTLLQSTNVGFGNRKKWKELVSKMNFELDWEEEIKASEGALLFRRAKTSEELRIKLASKVHSPGVTSSLSKGNDITRVIAAGLYILTDPITKIGSQWLIENETAKLKVRLCNLLMNEVKRVNDSNIEPLNDKELLSLFPFKNNYDDLEVLSNNFKVLNLYQTGGTKKKVKTEIEVIESRSSTVIPLEELCSHYWYDLREIPSPTRVIEADWNHYTSIYTWLKKSPSETLKESPFTTYSQLQNFLSRQDLKGRKIHLSASPVVSHSGVSNLQSLVNNDFFPGWTLTRNINLESSKSVNVKKALMHQLACIATTQRSDVCEIMTDILVNTSSFYRKEKHTSRAYDLGMIQEVVKRIKKLELMSKEYMESRQDRKKLIALDQMNSEKNFDIINEFIIKGRGIVGIFTKRQTFSHSENRYVGPGEWTGSIDNLQIRIQFCSKEYSKDFRSSHSVITSIECSSRDLLIGKMSLIKMLCHELKITNESSTYDRFYRDQVKENLKEVKGYAGESISDYVIRFRDDGYARVTYNKNLKFTLLPSHVRRLEMSYLNGSINVHGYFTESFFRENDLSITQGMNYNKIKRIRQEIEKKTVLINKTYSKYYKEELKTDILLLNSEIREIESEIMGTIKITIFRYKISSNDLDKSFIQKIWRDMDANNMIGTDVFWRGGQILIREFVYWQHSSADLNSIIQYLKSEHSEENFTKDSNSYKDKKSFLKQRLIDNLVSKGLLNKSLKTIDTMESNLKMMEMTDEEMNELLFGNNSMYFNIETETAATISHVAVERKEPDPSLDEYFNIEVGEIENLLGEINFSSMGVEFMDLQYNIRPISGNPLFENYLNELIKQIGESRLWNLLNEDEIFINDIDHLSNFMYVLDIPLESLKIIDDSSSLDLVLIERENADEYL